MRLELVRAAFIADEFATIAEAARSYGFVHLGRFSAAYRDKFGEYTSDTLAQARLP